MTAAAVLQPAYVRDARRRRTGLLLCAVIVCLAVAQGAHAWDPPHYNGPVGSDDCLRCHMLHGAPGGSMTSVAGNNNLCETCHIAGGSASSLPFADADQACPRVGIASGQTASGNSHRWDSGPTGHAEAVGTITSTGTLDTGGAFTGQYAKTYTITITTGGNVGVAAFSWADGRGGSGTGLLTGTNVALNEGITLTFTDGTPAPSFALNDKWRISVRTDIAAPTNGTLTTHLEKGLIMCSTCHDQHEQAVAPFDPAAPAYGGAGTGDGRHYLRTANDIDQMCLDCHRARNVASASDGSHPVGVTIPGSGAYKTPASLPLAPGGKVQCMTCHQPHFADSTDGSLTRNKNDVNLCTDCHTNCDTVSGAHLNAASGGVWPGDAANPQTYPAVDSAKRGQCTNCHAPHGWPDPTAAPAADYPKLLVARTDHKSDGTDPDTAEDLCFGCHNSTALPNRDLKTDFSKTYHHPVKDSEQSSGRSVECSDCHTDSHKVQAGSHDYAATATSARNTVANVEKGVSGLAVNYGSGITYTTGTAAITNGSAAVTGTGTTWTSTMIGARIRFAADLSDYTIVSVPSATSLTLGTAYAGATAATASHTITYAAYTVGTAAFTLNSTSVTGTGTAWTSDLAGKKIRRTSDMVDYTIASVGSPTSLTLTAAYAGTTTGTPQPYIISLGNFVAPTNAQCTVVPASTGVVYQYEVCFKCHSNYAFPTASTTGTADFTTGGTAVNGTGTSWTPDLTGAMLLRSGDTTAYTIAAVSSATSITLASAYAGITGTGASYTVTLPPRNLTPVLTGTNNATFVNGSTTVTVPANVFITTYSTGTAAATNGSGVLTGTGTSWSSSYVGATFKFTGDSTVYKITARTSSTSITISPVYGGTTGTGKAYTIFVGAGKTGTWLKPGTDNAYYKITGVVDATHLTITPAYSGSLGANVSWQMYAAGNDIAMEFSPNNKSGHPIVTGLDNYPNSIAVGTPAKKGLQPAAMLAPWNASYTTGTAALTAGSATATGTGMDMWLNAQALYDADLARGAEDTSDHYHEGEQAHD